ncbi:MAG: hypothetical protein Kow009_06680 [Spirochaetales bacterium]
MGKFLILTFFVLFSGQRMAGADPLVEARQAAEKGDLEKAYIQYSRWVESQVELDKEMDQLQQAIDTLDDLDQALKLIEAALPRLKEPVHRSRVLYLQASFLERIGAFEPSERAYRAAFEAHPVPSSLPYLFRSACLLFELGELEESEKRFRSILNRAEKPEDRWEVQFQLARIFAFTGRPSDALTVGKRLLEEAPSYGKDPRTLLYFLYEVTGTLGQKEEQELYRTMLEKQGGLLNHFLSARGNKRIIPMPLPSLFFSGAVPLETFPVSETSPEPMQVSKEQGNETIPSPRITGIQLGSFSHRENAEYLARDVKKLGFPSIVQQSTRKDGSVLYRTIVPVRTESPENSQTLLIRLKEHGYEGFFLFESDGE